jgi:hypothetical protein
MKIVQPVNELSHLVVMMRNYLVSLVSNHPFGILFAFLECAIIPSLVRLSMLALQLRNARVTNWFTYYFII